MLPGKKSDRGQTAADHRRFVEAVLWSARTGSPWRDLPDELGAWNSTYKRFARWSDAGVWRRVSAELGKDADFEEIVMDSTLVRAHPQAAGAPTGGGRTQKKGEQARGRSRGGLSTKVHAGLRGWVTWQSGA
jgi:transposase